MVNINLIACILYVVISVANMLGYKDKTTVRRYINPLLEQGRLAMTIPDKANSRNQKYITVAQ